MRAEAGGGIDGTRHGKDLPALVQGVAHRDGGAASGAGFHHHHPQGQAADDAVADGEILGFGGRAQGKLADQGSLPRDLLVEFLVFRRIDHVQAAAQDGQGTAAVLQGPLVGGGVDAPGQAAYYRQAPPR